MTTMLERLVAQAEAEGAVLRELPIVDAAPLSTPVAVPHSAKEVL